jgi:hypothetical protein
LLACTPGGFFSFALAAKSTEFDLIESTAAESKTNAHPQSLFYIISSGKS